MDGSLGGIILFGGLILAVDGPLSGLRGGVIMTGAGVAATVSGVKAMNDWWRISVTDSVPIDEAVAVDEPVQIRGRVRPVQSGDTLVSPIRNETCVAYEYKITNQVDGSRDSRIDSGVEYGPFVVSDGTAEVLVDPAEGSLSLDTETERVSGGEEMLQRVDERKVELEPSAHGGDADGIESPIELIEGTIGAGEEVTVVGEADAAPEGSVGDTDAVMTSEAGRLTVTNDDPGNAALRKIARGTFLLILGLPLSVLGVTALITAVSGSV